MTALYERHAVSMVRIALVMIGEPAAAEDVVQDAFFGLYRRWATLKDPDSALTYVRSAVLNGCRDALRQRTRRDRRDRASAQGLQAYPSAEAVALISEDHQRILAGVGLLAGRQREALVCRFYLGLSEDETARAMGISKGTVKSSTSRALSALRRMLKESAGATFAGITGAADDRTFVADTQPGALQGPKSPPNQQSGQPRTWYLLRISPGSAQPASLTRLAIPASPAGTVVMGLALSPDGTKLAAAFQTPGWGISETGSMTLRVYSVLTGAMLRSWTAPYAKGWYLFPPGQGDGFADDNLSLAWTGSGTVLAFGELILAPGLVNDGALPTQHFLAGEKILELPYATPSGTNLLSARVAFTLPGRAEETSADLHCGAAATTDLVFTADGQLLCQGTAVARHRDSPGGGDCGPGTPWYQLGLLEYATSGGARTLAHYTSNCPGWSALLPVWTSPSGSTQLGLLSLPKSITEISSAFGIFRDGKFTALPAPATINQQEDFPLSYVAW